MRYNTDEEVDSDGNDDISEPNEVETSSNGPSIFGKPLLAGI
jgi:hypothetical protein